MTFRSRRPHVKQDQVSGKIGKGSGNPTKRFMIFKIESKEIIYESSTNDHIMKLPMILSIVQEFYTNIIRNVSNRRIESN